MHGIACQGLPGAVAYGLVAVEITRRIIEALGYLRNIMIFYVAVLGIGAGGTSVRAICEHSPIQPTHVGPAVFPHVRYEAHFPCTAVAHLS
jgi:hypothetical protein